MAVSLASLRDNMMRAAGRSVFRARASAGAGSAGWAAARALGGIPFAPARASTPYLLRQLGAVWERRDAAEGAPPFGRGFACLGGGGCGGWGAPTATRALSSSSGDGGGGSSSVNDKLRLSREAREAMRWEGVGERAAGGAARGGRRGSGASARGGGGGGSGGRGGRGAGGGKGRSFVPNHLISKEEDPERLLHLVADKLDNFDHVNVATAFVQFGRRSGSSSFPRNIAADDSFRGLMARARAMCADGRLQARELANLTHAVAKMSAAGKLATADAGVEDMLTALEQRVVLVASGMNSQEVANSIWSHATLGRSPGAEAWTALEAAVVRVGPGMNEQGVANTLWGVATAG